MIDLSDLMGPCSGGEAEMGRFPLFPFFWFFFFLSGTSRCDWIFWLGGTLEV